jgi:hypothetical protein
MTTCTPAGFRVSTSLSLGTRPASAVTCAAALARRVGYRAPFARAWKVEAPSLNSDAVARNQDAGRVKSSLAEVPRHGA